MNQALANDIEKEFLIGEGSVRIQKAVTRQNEGVIEIFVRNGRHQMTTPPAINMLEGSKGKGLHLSAFEALVDTVTNTIKQYPKHIGHGYVVITYSADNDGMIETLNLQLREEFYHCKKKNGNKH